MPIERIKECFLFYQYSNAEIEEILRLAREQTFTPNEKIIEKSKMNEHLWILIEGKVVVRERTANGLDMNLHLMMPGELFGEYSFVDSVQASADVVALELTRVIRFSFHDLAAFFSRYPTCELKTFKQLARLMSRRLRNANRELKKSFMASMTWDQSHTESSTLSEK